MQGQLLIGFWMLHRCHQAASLTDKWFVYHPSCCCRGRRCSGIIRCSFTSTYHHSRKHQDKLKERSTTNSFPLSTSSKTHPVLPLGGVQLVAFNSGVKMHIIISKSFPPQGWFWASNVLPLDELEESWIHWLSLWLNSRDVDRIGREGREGLEADRGFQ